MKSWVSYGSPLQLLLKSNANLVLGVCILFVAAGTTISTKIEGGIGWISASIASIVAFIAIAIILFAFIR